MSELPISEAEGHLDEVAREAAATGEVIYLTDHGYRLAAVVSAAQLNAQEARAREDATAATCRALWASVTNAPEGTRQLVRREIDRLMEAAEDAADIAAAGAAMAEVEAGAPTIPADEAWAELGLDDTEE